MLIHSFLLLLLAWLSLSSAQLGDGPLWISPSPPIGQSLEQPAIWAFGDTIHFGWGATTGPYTLEIQATNETFGPQYTTQVSGTTLAWQVNLGTGACTLTLYDGVNKWAISVFCNIVEGSDAASPAATPTELPGVVPTLSTRQILLVVVIAVVSLCALGITIWKFCTRRHHVHHQANPLGYHTDCAYPPLAYPPLAYPPLVYPPPEYGLPNDSVYPPPNIPAYGGPDPAGNPLWTQLFNLILSLLTAFFPQLAPTYTAS